VATVWIISEADRSATTILFPDEYEPIDSDAWLWRGVRDE